MKPRARISSLSALVAAATACAFVQTAVAHTAPSVTEPLATATGPTQVSISEGTIAWAVRDHFFDPGGSRPGTSVWTLREGKPVLAASLPKLSVTRLDAGTDAAGHPVAIVRSFGVYLVRLDTGAVRQLHVRPGDGRLSDLAIDAGRVIYASSVGAFTTRGHSSLWTARLSGGELTKRVRLRRSRRGETFEIVRADRGRIAVTGYRKLADSPHGIDADLPLYAGTAHGRWRKVADGSISDRGVIAAEAAGFSRDRRSVIVTRTGLEDLDVQRVSLQSGRARNLMLEAFHPTVEIDMQAAYEPESNRLLLSSRVGFGGPYQLGWSSVLG